MVKFFVINEKYRLCLKDPDRGNFGSGLKRIVHLAKHLCHGQGLDIGGGKIFDSLPGTTVVDKLIPNTGVAEKLIQEDGTQDYVFSSHCLEHLSDPEQAVMEMHRVLKPGGLCFLYLPFPGDAHSEYLNRKVKWDPEVCPSARSAHKWQPCPASVSRLLMMTGFKIHYAEWAPDELHSFIIMGIKEDHGRES